MRTSAGILLFRRRPGLEYFLVHPGGPFWAGKDRGAWSIPKGEFTEPERPEDAALREFEEETGTRLNGTLLPLTPVRQKGGKCVYAWAVEGDIDPEAIVSNTFRVEWPNKSGRWQSYPEVDAAGWFSKPEALTKINAAQAALIEELEQRLQAGKAT